MFRSKDGGKKKILYRNSNALTDKEWGGDRAVHARGKGDGTTAHDRVAGGRGRLLYIAWTGYHWRALPDRFPPVSTLQRYFYACETNGLWKNINFHRVAAARLALGREASPSAGIIDSQSAKTTDVTGLRGYDAGKKIKGRSAIITTPRGIWVGLMVHPADIQDRDGAVRVIASIRQLYPWLRHLFADGGYAGEN